MNQFFFYIVADVSGFLGLFPEVCLYFLFTIKGKNPLLRSINYVIFFKTFEIATHFYHIVNQNFPITNKNQAIKFIS